jgi:hypothetical protein
MKVEVGLLGKMKGINWRRRRGDKRDNVGKHDYYFVQLDQWTRIEDQK